MTESGNGTGQRRGTVLRLLAGRVGRGKGDDPVWLFAGEVIEFHTPVCCCIVGLDGVAELCHCFTGYL
jgi:hypothetical protein